MPKNKGNDKILTVIFVIAILLGFYLVSMVNASFENDIENTILYKSDSNANFLKLDMVGEPDNTNDNLTTSVNQFVAGLNRQYEKSPIYFGNDTWSFSVNQTAPASQGQAYYIIELPNLENWIITDITLNNTLNLDNDLNMIIQIYSTPIVDKFIFDSVGTTILPLTNVGVPPSYYYNDTISVNLANSLDIQDKAVDGVQHFLYISIRDFNDNGMSPFAWDIEIQIEGKQIADYNIQQQLNLALGIAITINVVVIVFMTDEIDVGGFINDIPNKKKRS